jgi:PIN domain nuclease of toxin-antitoxin system
VRALLDTHAFLWFITGDRRMSSRSRSVIEDPGNDLLLSMASVWEMAIKTSLGKLQLAQPLDLVIPEQLSANLINLLPVTLNHAFRVSSMPFHHRDPFDRMLIAQGLHEGISILSSDEAFDVYGVTRLW